MRKVTVLFLLMICPHGIATPMQNEEEPTMRRILRDGVTAHRGNCAVFPENTLGAFESAIALGADWVELDVRLSSDGRLVVIHDETTGRVGDRDVPVAETPWSVLREIDVAAGFRRARGLDTESCPPASPPLLEEALQLVLQHDRVRVSIQPKVDCVAQVVALVRICGAAERVGFNDSNLGWMARAKELLPGAPVFWDRGACDLEVDVPVALEHGFTAIVPHVDALRAIDVDRVQAAGLEVGAWTVNDRADLDRLVRWGVDRIYTDDPGLLLDIAKAVEGRVPAERTPVVEELLDVAPVWAGHTVGFSLLTDGDDQFVAFYNADRRMTVGRRRTDSRHWDFTRLPEEIGWDSHNYVTMALDADGYLHVSGNMHGIPLVYFRSTRPRDPNTLERVETMVRADLEKRVTYPLFFDGPDGSLVFRYRDGGSGRGNDHYNVYDAETKTWRALLDHPLLDGQGRMNGYFSLPQRGPDGRYHMVGVWRDTPDAETNHHVSYARSGDLVHWETAGGEPLQTPMAVDGIDIVDPVPAGGGLLNGNVHLGFDSLRRPVVTYHKYDADGWMQIFAARFSEGAWVIERVSEWAAYRWDFGGRGSIGADVRLGPVRPGAPGTLTVDYRREMVRRRWILDEETLRPVATVEQPERLPPDLARVRSDFSGMERRLVQGRGQATSAGSWWLAWETLGPNRDRPREKPWPEPSMLQVVRVRRAGPGESVGD